MARLAAISALAIVAWGPALADHVGERMMARASLRMQAAPCWAGVEAGRTILCGELSVPRDWDDASSPMQRLPVVVFAADRDAPKGDPIVYLEGGPGFPSGIDSREGIVQWADLLADFSWTRGHDVIIPAQRGTAGADAPPRCPLLGSPVVFAGASSRPGGQTDAVENLRAAAMACRDAAIAAGYPLETLTTRQNATDIIALRHAMGIERWTLFGVSYGTSLGLTVMRHDGDAIASAVFDSVMLPYFDTPDRWPDAFQRTLALTFATCRASVPCRIRYGDLEGRLASILDRLRRDPVEIEVDDWNGSRSLFLVLDAALFLDILFAQMYWPDQIELVPMVIDGFDDGRRQHFLDFARAYLFDPTYEDYAFAMHYSVWCDEVRGGRGAEAVIRQAERFPLLRDWILEIPGGWITVCADWPMAPLPAGARGPVRSDVPTLLLAGNYDPATPVTYAEEAAKTLSRSQLFVFPAAGHAVLWSEPCADDIVAAFLEAPEKRPDTGCPDPNAELDFRIF